VKIFVNRRDFLGSAALAASAAFTQKPSSGAEATAGVPTRTVKVTKLFQAPDLHPNDLEGANDGLWIGDQVSERVFKVDWKTGKVLREIQTEAHNTTGIAIGAGYLRVSCNGGVSNRRPARPTDKPYGEVLQADLKTGKTVKLHPLPWDDGVHGIMFSEKTQTLWVVALSIGAIVEVDPKDFRILHLIPAKGDRPHGLDWDNGARWVVFATDRQIQKLDAKTGKVLEVLKIAKEDPDPQGLCLHEGSLYYCDVGLTMTSSGTSAGSICRIDLA
jgi:streptogramin lyase